MKIGAVNSQLVPGQHEQKNVASEITHPAQARQKEESIQGLPSQSAYALPEYPVAETEAAINKINRTVDAFNFSLRFEVHDESNRIMVQVIDKETDELIREIPPERLLRLAAQIQDMIGLLLDTRR